MLRWLNQKADNLQVIPRHQRYVQVQIDEVWSFVRRRKECKRWLFYAYAPETDEVLAWSWGNRSQHTVAKPYKQLQALEIGRFCTDDWPAFTKVLPNERHMFGKVDSKAQDKQKHLLKKLYTPSVALYFILGAAATKCKIYFCFIYTSLNTIYVFDLRDDKRRNLAEYLGRCCLTTF